VCEWMEMEDAGSCSHVQPLVPNRNSGIGAFFRVGAVSSNAFLHHFPNPIPIPIVQSTPYMHYIPHTRSSSSSSLVNINTTRSSSRPG
jgi:hypothetical protein